MQNAGANQAEDEDQASGFVPIAKYIVLGTSIEHPIDKSL